jgi:CRP/FNR family cyclic AMP-dependent transcriptional regulator
MPETGGVLDSVDFIGTCSGADSAHGLSRSGTTAGGIMGAADREKAIAVLGQSPLFKGIPHTTLSEMLAALKVERWPRHCAVMSPQQTVDRFYVLIEGRVKITRQNLRTGREVTLFLLGPGDGFNVVSLLDGRRHEVSAETLDAAVALSGPSQLWVGWLQAYPEFRRAVRDYVDTQMRHLADLAGDLALHDTMTRLAHLILHYFDGRDEEALARANLIRDLPHEELAHMIGTVRVVVNRLLAELKREGIVDTEGGKLRVLNLEKLLRKAERHVDDPSSDLPHSSDLSPP